MSKKRRNETYDYLLRTYGVAGTGGKNRANAGASPDPGQGAELSGGPAGVPARVEMEVIESTECVVGYRNWGLTEVYPVGYLLVSQMGQVTWPQFKRIEAKCKPMEDYSSLSVFSPPSRYGPPRRLLHDSPDSRGECWCGINAWREGVGFTRHTDPNIIQVVGSVNLWGRVIEYKEGWRGQYAYPKELAIIGSGEPKRLEKIATKLELAYGVPCQVWG